MFQRRGNVVQRNLLLQQGGRFMALGSVAIFRAHGDRFRGANRATTTIRPQTRETVSLTDASAIARLHAFVGAASSGYHAVFADRPTRTAVRIARRATETVLLANIANGHGGDNTVVVNIDQRVHLMARQYSLGGIVQRHVLLHSVEQNQEHLAQSHARVLQVRELSP